MKVSLELLRKQIDQLDDSLLVLLNQRMDLVKHVGELKRSTNTVIYRPEREKEIIDRLEKQSDGILNRQAIEAIFTDIFAVARNLELPEKIAYLGPEGTFTHQAAESRFGPMSEYLPLSTFPAVIESIESGRARFGVLPIENSREGTVVETVDLLYDATNIKIVAELTIPVNFCFAALDDNLDNIKKIYTKDIAFRQCSKFLREYFDGKKIEMIAVESTAKAAQLAAADATAAAICSNIGAKLIDLPVLFNDIGDSMNNRTRFYILAKDFVNQKSEADKTTIILELPNTDKAGVLATFLNDFKDKNINLTKIQNRPYKDRSDFSFWFFVEFEGYFMDKDIQEATAPYQPYIKWLGSYAKSL